MIDLACMSVAELENRLRTLEDELDELEEEKGYVLRQTGLHVSGGKVRQYEAQTIALQEAITAIKDELARRAGTQSA